MTSLTGPYMMLALLLALAGVVKVRRPTDAVGALRSVGLGVPAVVVRLLASAEIAIAAGALVWAGRAGAALLAATYAGFSIFVLAAMRRGGRVSSCGCFGSPDTPASATHLVFNATAALVALLVAADPGPPPVRVLVDSPGAGVSLLALVGLGTWFGYLVLAETPNVSALVRYGSRIDGARTG